MNNLHFFRFSYYGYYLVRFIQNFTKSFSKSTYLIQIPDNDTFNDSDWRQDETNDTETTQTKPTNWRKLQKRPKPSEYKYIKHREEKLCIEEFFTTYKVDHNELLELLESDRSDKLFLEYPFRCMSCLQSWREGNSLALHNKTRHNKVSVTS